VALRRIWDLWRTKWQWDIWDLWWTKWHWDRYGICGKQSGSGPYGICGEQRDTGTDMGFVVNKVAVGQVWDLCWTEWPWGRYGICGEQSGPETDMGFVVDELVLGQLFFFQVLMFYSQLSHIQCSICTSTCRWCFIVYILTVLLKKTTKGPFDTTSVYVMCFD
jgi:hypothetical protein